MRIEHPTDKANFSIVHLNSYSIAFSYETAIGFREDNHLWVVRENDWSNTTGKHLNYLDGGIEHKRYRIAGSEFEERLSKLVSTDAVDTEARR